MRTTKSIRANALLLAALHRANFVTATHFAYQINALRTLFLARTPHKSSFLTQVSDQTSYLPRTTADFDIPPDDAGEPPPPSMYTSASNHVACEGLNEQWYGVNR